MEAEKSFYLSSAHWRPKKTGDRIQRAEKWRADGVDSSLDLKAWQPGMPRARGDPCLREQMQSSSAFFLSIQAVRGLGAAHSQWSASSGLFSLPIQVNSFPETSSQIHPEITFNQLSGHPLVQARWHMTSTITNPIQLYPQKSSQCTAPSFLHDTAQLCRATCPLLSSEVFGTHLLNWIGWDWISPFGSLCNASCIVWIFSTPGWCIVDQSFFTLTVYQNYMWQVLNIHIHAWDTDLTPSQLSLNLWNSSSWPWLCIKITFGDSFMFSSWDSGGRMIKKRENVL